MRVLVVGGGGREHALAWKLSKSDRVSQVFCAPGNAGTALVAKNIAIEATDVEVLSEWVEANKIDLTVVGPEAPLVAGIVDVFEAKGQKIFGPTRAAAQLESSKAFAKEVMQHAGVRMPFGEVFEDYKSAEDYIKANPGPIVVKADGLAAGKGVTVCDSSQEALDALESLMCEGSLGAAGKRVVIEERIVGKEASVMAFIDGETIVPLVVSQDYKRLSDGDCGPNTGGMGAITPTPVLADDQVENVCQEVFLPVVRVLQERGIYYRGFLYAGLIIDSQGVARVLEFNCRLGDPETQVLMLRLESDLAQILKAAVDGKLDSSMVTWRAESAACVVAASGGYPESSESGKLVEGLFEGRDDLVVFHAGTRLELPEQDEVAHRVVTNGGRVLCVAGFGSSLQLALEKVYQGIGQIQFEGMQYRKDIGSEKAN